MDGAEDDTRWAEAFRAGEPLPEAAEWEARHRALRAAIAGGGGRARRRPPFWIPAAAAAAVLAIWGLRAWRPGAPPPPPAPAAFAQTASAALGVTDGMVAAIDGSVPLARRWAEETGRRWVAEPILGQAARAIEGIRGEARSAVRDLVAWNVETAF